MVLPVMEATTFVTGMTTKKTILFVHAATRLDVAIIIIVAFFAMPVNVNIGNAGLGGVGKIVGALNVRHVNDEWDGSGGQHGHQPRPLCHKRNIRTL